MATDNDVVLALVGQTATGKSAIALDCAELFGAEILSVDSMAIYRRMDVGTAKPSLADRSRIPHHLIDIAEPSERFTVARFQVLAREALVQIRARGRVPLIVGGSGLHFRAVVDDLSFPPEDPTVRARLDALPLRELAGRLQEEDPEAAMFVDLENKRRVVRAVEVIELTGRPFSSFREAWSRYRPVVVAGLYAEPDVLDARMRARLRRQLAGGLLDEVRALEASGDMDGLTARHAIPYTEARMLLRGEIDEDGFIEAATRASRRLARRQLAWFRRDPRVRWFDAADVGRARDGIAAYYAEQTGKGPA